MPFSCMRIVSGMRYLAAARRRRTFMQCTMHLKFLFLLSSPVFRLQLGALFKVILFGFLLELLSSSNQSFQGYLGNILFFSFTVVLLSCLFTFTI